MYFHCCGMFFDFHGFFIVHNVLEDIGFVNYMNDYIGSGGKFVMEQLFGG